MNLQTGVVTGADGSDTLVSIEKVEGSAYDDTLVGLNSWTFFEGGDGADSITGGGGHNLVSHYDDISGVTVNLATNSAVDGWGNTDTLTDIRGVEGSLFDDSLTGDALNNEFIGGAGDDTIDGGEGHEDTISFWDAATGVNVNLLAGTAQDGQGGTDSVSNVERAVGTAFDDTLTGDAGENGFEGAGGSDLIDGGANSRLLREMDVARYSSAEAGISASLVTGLVSDGSGGTDTLSNIEGLWGSSYDDTMVGDDNWGNVFIDGGGSDLIDGGSVHDHDTDTGFDMVSYYYGAAVSASITGTSGTVVDLATGTAWTDSLTNIDAVEGSAYGDSLVGGAGSQEFMPNEGNDTVRGGDGEDGVSYWNMEQTISVAWSTDHWVVDIAGGSLGTDLLYDIESIEGSEGADTFNASLYDYSGSYDLVFRGWNGADSFTGGTGWDVVSYWDDPAGVHVDLDGSDFGGSLQGVDGWGNQETLSGIEGIEGSAFDDTLRGNAEVNVFEGWKGNDIIDGGSSINTASYWSSTGGVTANLVTGSADDGMGGTDTLTGIANLIGSVYADSLTGDTLANELNGRGGDDTLVGGTGEPDTVTFKDDPAAVYLNLEAGTATDGWGDTDTLVEIEDVEGSKYDDTLLGSSGTNIIFGGEGDDLIRGGENDDTLSGGDGADTFQYTSMAELGSALRNFRFCIRDRQGAVCRDMGRCHAVLV